MDTVTVFRELVPCVFVACRITAMKPSFGKVFIQCKRPPRNEAARRRWKQKMSQKFEDRCHRLRSLQQTRGRDAQAEATVRTTESAQHARNAGLSDTEEYGDETEGPSDDEDDSSDTEEYGDTDMTELSETQVFTEIIESDDTEESEESEIEIGCCICS
jgi:hypothetical protein